MLLWPFAAFLLSVYSCWYQQQPVDLVGAGSILRFQLSCVRYVREPDQHCSDCWSRNAERAQFIDAGKSRPFLALGISLKPALSLVGDSCYNMSQ